MSDSSWPHGLQHARLLCPSASPRVCSNSCTGASQVVLVVKNPPANAGDVRDLGLISRSGRSSGGEWINPLQYSCLKNPMDRGAWQAPAQKPHRAAQSWTRLKWLSTAHMSKCVNDALQPSHSVALFSSRIRAFSNESALCLGGQSFGALASVSIFSFSINLSSEYWGLISFKIDWCDLLAVQETLKSLLQQHSSKASVLWRSAFLMVQLSHPYMTIGKTIALTRQTFVGKVMSLLFSMLSRLVIAFLPRSKRLLISWLQSLSAVIWEPKKVKSACFHLSPIYLPWKWWDWMPWSSFFWKLSFKPTFSTLFFHLHQEPL